MPAPGQTTYDAFISYSHTDDGRLGPALRDGLHQFARPWHQLRALRVFCDKRSLSASPGVWSTIVEALDRSRCFILLASPRSAESVWVRREVKHWQAGELHKPMIVVLTDGEIVWDHVAGDFDWARTTALPPSLRGWFTEEPLWVDLRHVRDAKDISLANPVFLDLVATIAAPLRNRSKDELIGEDVRQHRRLTRFRRLSLTGLSAATVLASVAAALAVAQWQEAAHQLRIATAQSLTLRAETLRGTNALDAVAMNLAAIGIDASPGNRSGLLQTLLTTHGASALAEPGTDQHDVVDVAISADGSLALTAGQARTVMIWDLTDALRPHRLATIGTPTRDVVGDFAVALSGDGRTALTAAAGGAAVVYDMAVPASPRQVAILPGPGDRSGWTYMRLSADGRTAVTAGGNGSVRLWDLSEPARPQAVGDMADHVSTKSIAGRLTISADGRTAALGYEDTGIIAVWRRAGAKTMERVGTIPTGGDTWGSVSLSPDGQTIAVPGGYDGTAAVWRVADGGQAERIASAAGEVGPIWTAALGADGRTLVMGGGGGHSGPGVAEDGRLALFDLSDLSAPRAVATLAGPARDVREVVLAADGRTVLATGTRAVMWRLDHPTSGDPVAVLRHADQVRGAALSADGRLGLTVDDSRKATLWGLGANGSGQPRPLAVLNGLNDLVGPVALSASGHTALVAAGNETVVWDVTEPSKAIVRSSLSASGLVYAVAVSGDGTIGVTGDREGTAIVWSLADPNQPRELRRLQIGQPWINDIALTTDGHRVLFATLGGGGSLWDLTEPATPRKLATLVADDGVTSVSLSADGGTALTSVGASGVLVWDLSSAQRPRRIAALTGHASYVNAVRLSSDGRTALTGSSDRIAMLWDLSTPAQPYRLTILQGHSRVIYAVALSADGQTALSASGDRTTRVWDVTAALRLAPRAHALACGLLPNGVSEDQWHNLVPGIPYRQVC